MKICFLVGTLARGGAERQLIFMLQALGQEGIKPRVLCLTKGETHEDDIRHLGIEPEWVGARTNRLLRLRQIVKSVRQRPVDIVQSSHFYTNIYAATVGKITRSVSIGAIRNDLTSEVGMDPIFGRWQLSLPSHLIANSELASDRAVSRGICPDRIDCLRNAVVVRSGKNETKRRCENLSILFVGRLTKVKRPELFLELAAYLTSNCQGVKIEFRIAGDGPLRRELEQMSTALGLLNKLVFLGEQADMSKIYAASDIVVLTSAYEGTPNVLLEAMANGLPVVAASVGGVPEILDSDRGFLVDPLNFKELAESVSKLVNDPQLRARLGANGKRYVERNHSIHSLGQSLIEIYQKVLSNQ